MIPRRVRAVDLTAEDVGLVVAHSVRDAGGAKFVLRKGDLVQKEHLEELRKLGERELHLVRAGPDELHENAAGLRLARAVAGPGVRLSGPAESQYTLLAEHRGLLRIDAAALDEVNALHGISVLTRFDYQPVDAGDELAGAKVTPLLLPRDTIERVEQICRERPPLRVRPFMPKRAAALILDRVDPKVHDRFVAALERKLDWFGSELVALRVSDGQASYAEMIREVLAERPDVVMAAGASSLDPLEPLFGALEELGARIVKHGVPVHPGSLFWIAEVGSTPLFGLSSCEMFSQKTILDLVLPRLLAGEAVGRADLVKLGHGGMLGREMAFRFPPYGERESRQPGP